MQITKPQIATIQTIISKLNLRSHKEDIVMSFSEGRTGSVSQLEFQEAKELIRHLKKQQEPQAIQGDRQRKRIYYYAHQMRWYIPKTKKIDSTRIDNWCVKYGLYHKPLMKHNVTELTKLVNQFQKMCFEFLERK